MKTKTIAFYDPYTTGHHVEYLYHIIETKVKHKIEGRFIFFVSKEFNMHLKELISLEELNTNQIDIIHIVDIINIPDFEFVQSLNSYKTQLRALNKIIVKEQIEHCVFMYLDNAMQIALSTREGRKINCKISGIVFNPFGGFGKGLKKYYYSFRRIMQNYIMLTNLKITAIYIITNKKTVKRLNLMHLTNKFNFVSDPILKTKYLAENKSKEVSKHERITFLLFGSLNKRKGVFKTLDAINMLSNSDLIKIKVVFAGKLAEADKQLFLDKYNEIKIKDSDAIELMDKFISYIDIPQLFNQTDFVLLPYDATQASSGILGHTAYYEKPVIGQGGGVFEQHVNEYNLGITTKELDEIKLFEIIKGIVDNKSEITCNPNGAKKYIDTRSADFFGSTIIKAALQ